MLASPPYFAVIECVPIVSDEVVIEPTPLESVTLPICVAPSKNVTVPVGELPVTVAVNVTDCPKLLGLSDETSDVDVVVGPGGLTGPCTVSVAVFEAAATPLSVESDVMVENVPGLVPVTLAETVHWPGGRVAPVREMELPAATGVPWQVVVSPLGEETASPAGKVSVKPTPVSVPAFGLLIVNVSGCCR